VRRLLGRIFGGRWRRSRAFARFVDEELAREDESVALREAALVMLRAGLGHLVGLDVTDEEALALAEARAALEQERERRLLDVLHDPPAVLRRLDGGRAERKAALRALTQEVFEQLRATRPRGATAVR